MTTSDENGKVQDGRVQATLDAILVRLSAVEEDIRNQRREQRTPAATWIAAGSLVVVLGTLSLSPVSRDTERNRGAIEAQQTFSIETRTQLSALSESQAGLDGRYEARREEVNRRFIEDVSNRMDRIEDRAVERFHRLRVWITNIEKEVDQHYRDLEGREE